MRYTTTGLAAWLMCLGVLLAVAGTTSSEDQVPLITGAIELARGNHDMGRASANTSMQVSTFELEEPGETRRAKSRRILFIVSIATGGILLLGLTLYFVVNSKAPEKHHLAQFVNMSEIITELPAELHDCTKPQSQDAICTSVPTEALSTPVKSRRKSEQLKAVEKAVKDIRALQQTVEDNTRFFIKKLEIIAGLFDRFDISHLPAVENIITKLNNGLFGEITIISTPNDHAKFRVKDLKAGKGYRLGQNNHLGDAAFFFTEDHFEMVKNSGHTTLLALFNFGSRDPDNPEAMQRIWFVEEYIRLPIMFLTLDSIDEVRNMASDVIMGLIDLSDLGLTRYGLGHLKNIGGVYTTDDAGNRIATYKIRGFNVKTTSHDPTDSIERGELANMMLSINDWFRRSELKNATTDDAPEDELAHHFYGPIAGNKDCIDFIYWCLQKNHDKGIRLMNVLEKHPFFTNLPEKRKCRHMYGDTCIVY